MLPDLVEMISNLTVLKISSGSSECHEELDNKVDDLDPTKNGEASEEAHGAANQSELAHKAGGVQASVVNRLLDSVICGRVKVDLNQL